jgi:hypothetical protein
LEREKGKAMGRIVFCENGAEERIWTEPSLFYRSVNLGRLNGSTERVSFYLVKNKLRLNIKDQSINALSGNNNCYSVNHTNAIKTLSGQNAELYNVKG